jgi:hypothetical protein
MEMDILILFFVVGLLASRSPEENTIPCLPHSRTHVKDSQTSSMWPGLRGGEKEQ